MFVIARTIARQHLPNSGRLFLESKSIASKEDFREGLADWLSTRMRGNYFKPVGGGSEIPKTGRQYRESSGGGDNRPTCSSCGKPGHNAADCQYPRV